MSVDREQIQRGALLLVRDAHGNDIKMRALARPEQGYKFPIVRVCTEAGWDKGGEGAIPWPLESVLAVLPETGETPA